MFSNSLGVIGFHFFPATHQWQGFSELGSPIATKRGLRGRVVFAASHLWGRTRETNAPRRFQASAGMSTCLRGLGRSGLRRRN